MSDALGKIEREEGRHEPGSSKPAHDHSGHGGHGHAHVHHAHAPSAESPSVRPRRSRSLFLASAFDRLLLVIVVIGGLWLGVAWAIL